MAADFKQALRMLRNSPVFAVTAILTIALGIGASTAIFSVTNAVLLRPLPYLAPDRLVLACSDFKKRDVKDFPWSNADFIDLRNGATANFEEFAAVNTFRNVVPREDGSPEQVRVAAVTTNFFRLMGGKIVAGRDFQDSDGQPQPPAPQQPAGAQAVAPPRLPVMAILSYDYWRRRFGGSSTIFGHPLLGSKGGPTVVGVLAPGFELLLPPSANIERLPDYWIAARLNYDVAARNNVAFHVIGRLKPAATLQRAQSEVDTIAADLRGKERIHQTAGFQIRLEPMSKFLVANVRPAIVSLMGAVIFLLLIACANVANLFLVRVSLRARDLAVRTALGGSRWRLVRQMMAEAALIAGMGAAAGVALAWAGIRELLAIAPANLPRLESIHIDRFVLLFAIDTAAASAAIFGIVPALRASRPDVMQILRSSARTSGLSGGALVRNAIVVAEVALCFVLLIGSGLMLRSFLALQRIDPGFDAHHLLAFSLGGGARANQPQQRAAMMRNINDRLRAIPGVEAVAASFPFPLTGNFTPIRWGKESALADPSKFQAVDWQIVLPGYFEAMRTPLIEGRTFTDADNAPARNLVVVDRMLAAKAFPGQSAVGKRILIRVRTPQPEWVEIIGVVAHQRQTELADAGREQVYFTDGFLNYGVVGWWAVRTAGAPGQYTEAIRRAIGNIDRTLLITELQPMEALVTKAQAGTRFSLLLIAVFAAVATLLAAVGLYGVLSTVVRQRTAEIGVRMALGADPSSIFQLVVGHGLRLSMAGIGVGLIAAAALTRIMNSMLIGVKPTDPLTYAAIAALFLVIASAGSWLPARRAAGLQPASALREE